MLARECHNAAWTRVKGTHDDRREKTVAYWETDIRAKEGGDAERDGREGVDGRGLNDGFHDSSPHAIVLRARRTHSHAVRGPQDALHDKSWEGKWGQIR